MYSTCLFCHADLGTNEAIEAFPVGHRLAFDAAQGRLWVVCRKCERWNLTPLDERWEAVEQCERLFSSTKLRVSTDNIGLARLRDGTELVRIGSPMRPEMAAWRYGDQFGRRRRRYVAYTVGGGVIAAGILIAGPAMGIVAGGSIASGGYGTLQLVNTAIRAVRDRVVRTRVAIPGYAAPSVIRGIDVRKIVISAHDDGWSMRLPYNRGSVITSDDYPSTVTLHGEDALRAASTIMPVVNMKGAKKEEVDDAVRVLERNPDPHALMKEGASMTVGMAGRPRRIKRRRERRQTLGSGETFIDRIHSVMSLAIEMATHEDIERRAMEGELAILEQAWRQAEEIAAISDNLFTPASVDEEYAALAAKKDQP